MVMIVAEIQFERSGRHIRRQRKCDMVAWTVTVLMWTMEHRRILMTWTKRHGTGHDFAGAKTKSKLRIFKATFYSNHDNSSAKTHHEDD